jgi:uncharacterized protein YdeI (YjbR/CyaY-like superfamily)
MGRKDPRVDDYIDGAAEFARPVLKHLRKMVHTGCPDVEETLKWSMPAFMYKGMFCGMAAFKQHCTFGFWKDSLLRDRIESISKTGEEAMGSFGRITSKGDLPVDKELLALIKAAAALNDAGVTVPRKKKVVGPRELEIPADLAAALKKNRKAQVAFDGFSFSHRKEYVEWITEAKGEETRKRRLDTTLEWLVEGKSRNWKYERK